MSEHESSHAERGGVDVAVRLAEHLVSMDRPLQREPEAEEGLSWQDVDARAKDIAFEIGRHKDKSDPLAGRRSAHEAYVEQETESPFLQKFGKLMILAPRAYEEESRADELRKFGRDLTPDQDEQLKRSKRIVCAYNQMIGSMIDDDEAAVPRRKLERWMSDAVGGHHDWAETLVAAIATESAAEKLLWEVPGLEGIMHGDLDQDLMGDDLLFDRTPSGYESLDVKSAHLKNGKLPVERDRTGRMILNIDPRHMDRNGYEVKERWRPGYVDELTMKLMK